MAYAHGVTRDDVYAAASGIFSQGKNPTQAAVRAELGKGSFATISKYLQEWRQEQQESGVDFGESQSIPDEHLRQLQRFYWGLRSSVEVSSVSDQVEILEQENERLRQRQENYDAIAAELAGLRFAYQEALTRMEQVTRENERLEHRLREVAASTADVASKVEQGKDSQPVENVPEALPRNKGGRPRKSTLSTTGGRRKSTGDSTSA